MGKGQQGETNAIDVWFIRASLLAATADCEGSVKQKGCGVISRIYGAEGLGERQKKKKGQIEAVYRAGLKYTYLIRRKTV